MAVYTPKHFSSQDVGLARRIVASHPFATLISMADSEPWITHLPMIWDEEANALLGHVARANPQAAHLDGTTSATAVFVGPHAYVSPRWYATPGQVPTWNYAIAHIHGVPKHIDHEGSISLLLRLARQYDADLEFDPGMLERQSLAIVAFSMPIARIDLKLKLSQNKPEVDRLQVVEALLDRDGPDDRALASWMASTPDRS